MSETKKKSKERKNFKINSTSVFCATVVHCEENHYVLKKVVIYGKDEKGMLFEGEEDHVNIFDAADVELLTNIGVKNDDKIQFNAEVYKYVRQMNNEWMVDHASRFVAVYSSHPSEARNTIEYAKKKEFLPFCAVETPFLFLRNSSHVLVNTLHFRELLLILF